MFTGVTDILVWFNVTLNMFVEEWEQNEKYFVYMEENVLAFVCL